MKKIIFSVIATLCVVFFMSSCSSAVSYSSEDLFEKPASEVYEGDYYVGSLLKVVRAADGVRLGNTRGPLLTGKSYVNEGKEIEKGDWAMIYRNGDDFYIYYSENNGEGVVSRLQQAKQWCDANLK